MRSIVISGSASGIGLASRERLEAAGDRVIGIDIRDAEIIADLSTAEGRQQAIAEALEATGSAIDGLVLSAGVSGIQQPGDFTVSLNYYGSVDLLDGLRPAMQGRPNACAIGLVSNSSQFDIEYDDSMVMAMLDGDEETAREMALQLTHGDAYRFTKHALARAIRRRAVEWGPLGVRINAIVPGMTETPMVAALKEDPQVAPMLDLLPIPLGRKGTAAEMAGVISFLLSEDAAYVHGMMMWVDGGTDAAVRPDRF